VFSAEESLGVNSIRHGLLEIAEVNIGENHYILESLTDDIPESLNLAKKKGWKNTCYKKG
jgi:hypothetical protein